MKTHAKTQRSSCRTAALLGGLVLALALPGTGLRAQVPDISKSVLLSWPDSTQEQIVVGSDSLTGPVWTPWPEPIFKRFGQMSMAVPTTASQQFFRTALGRQFADDFSNAWGPFTNRNSWMDYFKEPGEQWFVTNGFLRLTQTETSYPGWLLMPVGTNAAASLRDFCTSVDLLDWVTIGTNWLDFGLVGRGVIYGENKGNGYIGILTLNDDGIVGNATLFIWDGDNYARGPSFNTGAIPPPYRLEFCGVGNNLRLRVLNQTTKELIREQTLVRTKFSDGWTGIWIQPQYETNSFTLNADNFFMSGTK